MADLTRSVRVMLLGEDVNLDKTMKNASKDFDKFSQSVQDATAPLANFGKKAAMTEAALIAMVAGGMAYAAKQASDFDTQFREITTLLDDTGESVDQFRGDILEYAQSSTKSIDDINGAIYNAISAGVDYKDALDSLSDAEELAVATKADLNASTKTLVSTLNAYGASSDEAGQYAEILFETVKNGQTTMEKLSGKIANVTSIAANSGVSFDELAAAIAATTAAGVRTEQSITGLRQTISNIIKPTSQAQEMAEKLGIQFNAQALEAGGLEGVLQDVKDATGGNTEQMAQLFGSVEALNVVMALTGEGAEKFASTLEQTAEHTGSLSTAYGKMADDIKNQTQTLLNTINTTLIGVGDRIISSFEGVPDAASELVKNLGGALDEGAFDEVFSAIDRFAKDFEETLLDIAEVAPEALRRVDFSGLIDAFENLGGSLQDAFDALMGGELDLSTVEGVQDAFQRLVDVFAALTNFTSGFVDGVRPLIRVLGEMAEGAGNADEKAQKLLGRVSGLAQTANTAAGALDGLKNGVWALAGAIGLSGSGGLVGTMDKLGGVIGRLAGTGAVGTGGLVIALATAFDTAYDKAMQFFGIDYHGILDSFGGLQENVQNIVDVLTGKRDWWTGEIKEDVEEASRATDDFYGRIPGITERIGQIDDAWFGAIDGITNNPPDVSSTENAIDDIKKQFKELGLEVDWDKVMEIDADTSEATKKITDLPPTIEKMDMPDFEIPVEIQTKEIERDIAHIEANARKAEAAFEYKAKVETAEIEKFQTAIEEAGATARSSKEAVTDMLSAYRDTDIGEGRLKLSRMLDERFEMEKESHQMQQKINQEQLELMRQRKEQMEEGESAMNITIDDSVEPALRLVMMNILELMQTELNQYADQFLVGVGNVTQ